MAAPRLDRVGVRARTEGNPLQELAHRRRQCLCWLDRHRSREGIHDGQGHRCRTSDWPKQAPNPFTDALNRVQKYVASTTLHNPLPWQNSRLLEGDARDAVARLKNEIEENLVIFGSGVLVRALLGRGLVDEILLQIHPLVLGTGRRLFPESTSAPRPMQLVDAVTTPTQVILATYRPCTDGSAAG
jgi:dihydrofolate reductase